MTSTHFPLQQAKELLESVRGTPLSRQERVEKAISLAASLLRISLDIETSAEKQLRNQLGHMVEDPKGKAFTVALCDQSFRSHNPARIADQIRSLIHEYGVPSYLTLDKRLALKGFAAAGNFCPSITVPLIKEMVQAQVAHLILPGEEIPLTEFLQSANHMRIKINLNRIGEAILGEDTAKVRMEQYLRDIQDIHIPCMSIKISTLYSQIQLQDWEETLAELTKRLKILYRAILARPSSHPLFLNLDMEEFRDLELTKTLFQNTLSDPEFHTLSAGIALQSYIPDSFAIQKALSTWAEQRRQAGGAPIKIRLVKGANLAMESYESALKNWPQAPYATKSQADANYKRMLEFGLTGEHPKAVHLGVASHNLFDVSYALILQHEFECFQEVEWEMLRGMSGSLGRAVQELAGTLLYYSPVAGKKEFEYAIPYLVRRFDENSAPENFLRSSFHLTLDSPAWKEQVEAFQKACAMVDQLDDTSHRTQNRLYSPPLLKDGLFQNEPDTDWTLAPNRLFAKEIFSTKPLFVSPCLYIAGQERQEGEKRAKGMDPYHPEKVLYTYPLASWDQVDEALEAAAEENTRWGTTSWQERADLLLCIANGLRAGRKRLLQVLMADTGKTLKEADSEVSEAIDFATYYRKSLTELHRLPTISWKAKGTVLVASPWNFACSIAAGGILGALASANCVLFKPAPEAVLVGWELAQIFWESGVSKRVLQFLACEDQTTGSRLVQDSRLRLAVLTGETKTAKLFLQLHPGLDLIAETGGKNIMLVSALADRDLAIKELVHSAFDYAGQKCSACSLAILEEELYHDTFFLQQLKDAAESLRTGSQWTPGTSIPPLIRPPGATLLRGLTQLEEGETWLLRPQNDPSHPHVWSPGIKLGVQPGSFTFQTELFGPVLGLVQAKNFAHGLSMINQTAYGLTAGLQSLDKREQLLWRQQVQAGNGYINRGTTGAIVQRQPFGGWKESRFGIGYKAGGPNYLIPFFQAEETGLPQERQLPREEILHWAHSLDTASFFQHIKEKHFFQTALESYAFFWEHYFSKGHDPSSIPGQENLLLYRSLPFVCVRNRADEPLYWLLTCMGAAFTTKTPVKISVDPSPKAEKLVSLSSKYFEISLEKEEDFQERIHSLGRCRTRFFTKPTPGMQKILAAQGCDTITGPPFAHGRLELLAFLQEQVISFDYQRYGNLGLYETKKDRLDCCLQTSCLCR